MESVWKITSQFINGQKMFAIYRIIDVNRLDSSGNREYAGGYVTDRETLLLAVEDLNKVAINDGQRRHKNPAARGR